MDQLRTLRELLRDAIEVARRGAADSKDQALTAAFDRARSGIAAALTDLDDVATSRPPETRS